MKKGWIYRITFEGSNKVYYGKTLQGKARIRKHLCELRNGRHVNEKLQEVFDRCGESCFKWEVVEEVEVDRLEEVENVWIATIWGQEVCLNKKHKSAGGVKKHTEKTKQLISKNRKAFFEDPENRRKLSEKLTGRKLSKEIKRKIGEAHKGRWGGENNPFYGKTHSEENKRKISEASKRRWQKWREEKASK